MQSLRKYFKTHLNVGVLGISTLGLALGEELWTPFLPKYLVALGGSGLVVGFFSSAKDLIDGLYQFPGGWWVDRFGRKNGLMVFTAVAGLGYVAAVLAPSWEMMFAALVLIMAWKSGAFAATFAVIGDSLPPGKRAFAFSIISVLQRFPRVIGAPIGGILLGVAGVVSGVRAALLITILLAFFVLYSQHKLYAEQPVARRSSDRSVRNLFTEMAFSLKALLAVECVVRTGESLASAFIVLYVIDLMNAGPEVYGLLFALQQATAILLYIPSGRLADMTGRKPIIALTFFFFALFPLVVFLSPSTQFLVVAFVIGGLKEFGEPARKSLIVDLADPAHRGTTVGLYYAIRNLAIVPAGIVGGILWHYSPAYPLVAASGVGLLGTLLFLVLARNDRFYQQ